MIFCLRQKTGANVEDDEEDNDGSDSGDHVELGNLGLLLQIIQEI